MASKTSLGIADRAATRYWRAWPEIYATLFESDTEAMAGSTPRNFEPLDDDERARPWLVNRTFAGPFPIAELEDAKKILDASDAELRKVRPVVGIPQVSPTLSGPSLWGILIWVGPRDYRQTTFVTTADDPLREPLRDLATRINAEKVEGQFPDTFTTDTRAAWLKVVDVFWGDRSETGNPPKQLRHISPIPQGDFLMPSAKVFQATHRSLVTQIGWEYEGNDFPIYDDEPSGLRFSIGGIAGDGKFNPETKEGFQADLAALDPELSICYAAAMGAWTDAYHHNRLEPNGGVAIHVNDILKLRNLKRQTGGDFKPEQKREVKATLDRLKKLQVQGPHKLPNGKVEYLRGQLIEVTEAHEDLFSQTPYRFFVRPGMAVQRFFVESPQLATFFSRLAIYDTRQGVEKMAYLLGLYLAFQWRVRSSHGNLAQPFNVKTLLTGARVQIQANPGLYKRFQDQFEEALNRLQTDGIISSWEYDGDEYTQLPTRGWFSAWLKCNVAVSAPDSVVEQAELVFRSARKVARKLGSAKTLTAAKR